MKGNPSCYYGYRFPPGIISYAVCVCDAVRNLLDVLDLHGIGTISMT